MTTKMRTEIEEIPLAAERLLRDSGKRIRDIGLALRERDPPYLITVARGSSDHAASFLKYAIELRMGRPVASLGPSLASLYDAPLKLAGAAAIAISQSGQSPDIVALQAAAGRAGAVTIALTNTPGSPIASASTHALDIAAGPEAAVAATKSFVNSIVAGLAILAEWTDDEPLRRAVSALPALFAKAISIDWSGLSPDLARAGSLFVLGRGPTMAIAQEAALKFKETSGQHAEAFSAAEVMHGPVALVSKSFPVIAFAARDAAEASVVAVADNLARAGAPAYVTSDRARRATHLGFLPTGHPLTDALALILPFYVFLEAWSRSRGLDPDAPAALNKVTETR